MDGGTLNSLTNRALAGLLDEGDLTGIPFWQHCEVERFENVAFWPFGRLLYTRPESGEKFPVLASNGAWHLQKRFSLQHCSACKVVVHGDLVSCTAPCGRMGIGQKALGCSDAQSAVALLSSTLLELLAHHVVQLLAGLLASISTASKGFSKKELATNGFTLYYLVALHLWYNRTRHGSSWAKFSLEPGHRAQHGILGSTLHPCCDGASEPRQLQELAIESHFSRIKDGFRGTPAVKDGVRGIAVDGAKQLAELRARPDFSQEQTQQPREGLSRAELARCSKEALSAACLFQTMITIDQTAAEVYQSFRKWFQGSGLP